MFVGIIEEGKKLLNFHLDYKNLIISMCTDDCTPELESKNRSLVRLKTIYQKRHERHHEHQKHLEHKIKL